MPFLPQLFTFFCTRHALRPLLLSFAAATLAVPAPAQILPDAPVVNFRLPMFADDGTLTWDLRGQEGRYVSEEQVDLSGMRLLVFASEQPDRVETEITSPNATMFIQENQVRGDDSITVRGENFVITGQSWLWDAEDQRVVIDEDVKITFFEGLSRLLVVQ